jgi:hypothetical protein
VAIGTLLLPLAATAMAMMVAGIRVIGGARLPFHRVIGLSAGPRRRIGAEFFRHRRGLRFHRARLSIARLGGPGYTLTALGGA